MFVTSFVRRARLLGCCKSFQSPFSSLPEQLDTTIAPLSDALLVRLQCVHPVVLNSPAYDLSTQDHLRTIVPTVSTNPTVLQAHGQDESYHTPMPPQAVVYPTSHEQVVEVVKACAARHTPMVPFGAGTSLEGHIAAVCGGVCVDMSRMNAILEVGWRGGWEWGVGVGGGSGVLQWGVGVGYTVRVV